MNKIFRLIYDGTEILSLVDTKDECSECFAAAVGYPPNSISVQMNKGQVVAFYRGDEFNQGFALTALLLEPSAIFKVVL